MVQIKICGITNIEDGLSAAEAGADALGFVFHPASPRYVEPGKVEEIIRMIPPSICTVGVFVNLAAAQVLQIAERCGLDYIQLHGSETADYCRQFPRERLIKALSIQSEEELAVLNDYPVSAYLVDARDPVRFGGTGKTCDWTLAGKVAARHPLILAGGLGAENVLAALEAVHPLAVDVSSGVERKPGKKDYEQMRSLITAVRRYGKRPRSDSGGKIFQKA